LQVHLRQSLETAWAEVDEHALVVVTAPGGSGKTTLARAWAEHYLAADGRLAWLSLGPAHRDPVVFVEDCVATIRAVLPEPLEGGDAFGTALLRVMPRTGTIRSEPIVPLLVRELRGLTSPLVLVLDAFEYLDGEGETAAIVDGLLRSRPDALRILVTTRGLAPRSTPRLLAEGAAKQIGAADLNLRSDQMAKVLEDAGVQLEVAQAEQLLARTEGWAIAIRFAGRALAAVAPEARSRFIEGLIREDDLFRYITHELIAGTPDDVVEVLETACIVGVVDRATLVRAVTVRNPVEAIDAAIDVGLLQSDPTGVGLHDLLADWLRLRRAQRLDDDARRAEHARLGELLEESRHEQAALRVYREAGLVEPVAALLGRHAHAWVNRGQYASTAEALAELPPALRESDPRLRAVTGILAGGQDPDEALEHLRGAVEMYREAGNKPGEFEALHELGIIAMNENRMEEVMGLFRYALTLRGVLLEPRLRGMLMVALGDGLFVAGRYGFARRLLRVAETYEHGPRERGGITLVQSTISFYRGEWDQAIALVEERCADAAQREHGAVYFAMQTRRCQALGLRGIDVAGCRETLREGAQMFVTSSQTLNLMHCELVHGQIALRAGDVDDAIERLRHSSALAARIRQQEAECAASGFLARALQRRGDIDEAASVSGFVLDRLSRPETFTSRFSTAPFWAASAALAGVVHAEVADADLAYRVIDAKRAALEHKELPLLQHALGVVYARVAERAGHSGVAVRSLRRAEKIHTAAALDDYAPEIDDALLGFARQRPEAWGASEAVGASVTADAPRAIRITSFGGLSVERDARTISDRQWRGSTARRLLVRLLAADGRAVAREVLEADLWPDASASRGRGNLRVALSRLRDVLEPRRRKGAESRFVEVAGERVGLSAEAIEGWDVTRWRACLQSLRVASQEGGIPAAREALDDAVGIRDGGFVPESFEDWTLELRRGLDETWLAAARETAAQWLDANEPGLSAAICEALLADQRDDEPTWELLVRARLAANDRSGALRAIAEARAALDAELGLASSAALDQLDKQARRAEA